MIIHIFKKIYVLWNNFFLSRGGILTNKHFSLASFIVCCGFACSIIVFPFSIRCIVVFFCVFLNRVIFLFISFFLFFLLFQFFCWLVRWDQSSLQISDFLQHAKIIEIFFLEWRMIKILNTEKVSLSTLLQGFDCLGGPIFKNIVKVQVSVVWSSAGTLIICRWGWLVRLYSYTVQTGFRWVSICFKLPFSSSCWLVNSLYFQCQFRL